MTFPLDKRFRGFHSLHFLLAFVFNGFAAMMLYEKKADKALIFGLVGSLFGLTFLAGIDQEGKTFLPFAGTIGVILGIYPYQTVE